jgi:CRP-like cAMP-binding protein
MWSDEPSPWATPHWRAMLAAAGVEEEELRKRCRRRRYARGEVIFHEGDPAAVLHLLDVGSVTVRLTTALGDVVTVGVFHAGDTFGEHALVDDVGVRTATVTALARCETLTLDRAGFDEVRAAHPGVDRFLLAIVCARLRATTHQLVDALHLPAEVRVMRCVHRVAAGALPGGTVTVPFTQAEIASMSGVTRSTANRVLRAAQETGVLRIARAHLEVLDAGALARRAGFVTHR